LLLSAVRAETSIDRGERRAGRKYQTRRAPDAQQQTRQCHVDSRVEAKLNTRLSISQMSDPSR